MTPNCNSKDCEVVESWADGKSFWYCRTCKDEVDSSEVLPFKTHLESNTWYPRNKDWPDNRRLKLNKLGELELDKDAARDYYKRRHKRA